MEIQEQNEKVKKGDEKKDNKTEIESNENITKSSLYDDINENKLMIEFFNYAKSNLSICIDEIIVDEENKKE